MAFLVDAGRELEAFSDFRESYKVVIRDLDFSLGGERHWFYEFNTADPEAFIVSKDGQLSLPEGYNPVLTRQEWGDNERVVRRYQHLFELQK